MEKSLLKLTACSFLLVWASESQESHVNGPVHYKPTVTKPRGDDMIPHSNGKFPSE